LKDASNKHHLYGANSSHLTFGNPFIEITVISVAINQQTTYFIYPFIHKPRPY